VLYLLHYQLLPEDRLVELMRDLFGVKLVAATIARMSRSYAERLAGFVEALRKLVAGAPVKHMDETGFRIGGKTQWLHIASTAALTFYRVCARRGSLLANVIGTVVHDLRRDNYDAAHRQSKWPTGPSSSSSDSVSISLSVGNSFLSDNSLIVGFF